MDARSRALDSGRPHLALLEAPGAYPRPMYRLAVLTPFAAPSVRGNAITVSRVVRGLRERGLDARVWDGSSTSESAIAREVEAERPALIHAFHAFRAPPLRGRSSGGSLRRRRALRPRRRVAAARRPRADRVPGRHPRGQGAADAAGAARRAGRGGSAPAPGLRGTDPRSGGGRRARGRPGDAAVGAPPGRGPARADGLAAGAGGRRAQLLDLGRRHG